MGLKTNIFWFGGWILPFAILAMAGNAFSQTGGETTRRLTLQSEHDGPVVDSKHTDVVSSENKSGFETGQVVKLNGVYYMFVNEMFERPHRDLRISFWTSDDAESWKRQSTVVESIPRRTATNPRSEVWVTGVVFNTDENAWNIFYVAYRAGDPTIGEFERSDYEGKIWRAKSVVPGESGIKGPYADMAIVLQPDENSQSWEGQQAIASFNPYKVGDRWYSVYDGHNYNPLGGWPSGLATSPKLSGPWTRLGKDINPLSIVETFMENAVVTHLKDGRYLMVFDSFGEREIGYSLSNDGLQWEKEKRIKIQSDDKYWAANGDHAIRTPLGAIEEEDGTFTVIYTALVKSDNRPFYAIGKCTLKWE